MLPFVFKLITQYKKSKGFMSFILNFKIILYLLRSEAGNWILYPEELKTEIRRLVTNFHSLFGTLGLKEDIWSVGPFSKVNTQLYFI